MNKLERMEAEMAKWDNIKSEGRYLDIIDEYNGSAAWPLERKIEVSRALESVAEDERAAFVLSEIRRFEKIDNAAQLVVAEKRNLHCACNCGCNDLVTFYDYVLPGIADDHDGRVLCTECLGASEAGDDSDVENCWAESDADCDQDEKGKR